VPTGVELAAEFDSKGRGAAWPGAPAATGGLPLFWAPMPG